jgi:hypothetical protein
MSTNSVAMTVTPGQPLLPARCLGASGLVPRLLPDALERHDEVERQWLAGEAATRGNMVNARGRALGISERSLFTGSEDQALRYASPELKNYWQDHPRPTAASMSSNYQIRRNAAAGSNLGREQARVVRTPNGSRVTMSVKRKAA